MSRYVSWGHSKRFADRGLLVKALEACGFSGRVEVHDSAVPLVGYEGTNRAETAEVVIPRRYVGGASNDIGFRLMPDGMYEPLISEFDGRQYGEQWLGKLMAAYSLETVHVAAREFGGEVTMEEALDDAGNLVNRYVLSFS